MGKSKGTTSKIMPLVSKIVSFSPRQAEKETRCAEFIKNKLKEYGLDYELHGFKTRRPNIEEAALLVDGKRVECAGCSMVSGSIENADNIISSLADIGLETAAPNINFNPRCREISRSYYYWAPAVAVRPCDLNKIIEAKEVKGTVQVQPVEQPAENILVGNSSTPEALVFAHYDSIETGATDNASGTAVVLSLLLEQPELAKKNLFVFSADEELSYDKPIYWGHGFRALENDHPKLFQQCRVILVVDSLGNGETTIKRDEYLIKMAFPVRNVDRWRNKISICCGDMDKLMSVYHSKLDGVDQLEEKYLRQASEAVGHFLTDDIAG